MNPPLLQLSDTDRERLEQLLVDFDQHWTSHHLSVVAEQLLVESVEFRVAALTELAKIDLDYRQQQEPTRVERYLERFPELGESLATLCELLQAEIMVREAAGDRPTKEELRHRFAALDEQQAEVLFANVAQQEEFSAIRSARRHDEGHTKQQEVSDSTKSMTCSAQETLPLNRPRKCKPEEPADGSLSEFGRYRLLQELGRGAMGTVYLAEDTELRRRVALKRPRIAGTDEASLLERFYREAYAAATLDHPNICSVYDIGQHDGIPYITMAYVEGKPLSRVIRERLILNPQAIAVLVRKIAFALAEAHAKGVIHRDLKPGNIMLNHRSDPIVMDFGLARQVEDVKERLTIDGTLIGTPGYMSPEQVDGDLHNVGPASDIYSLGVVLFELLTSRLPFQGSVTAVIGKIVRDQPPAPSSLRTGVPRLLEEICLKMMAKSPADRYGTMTDVAEVLGAFIKSSGAGPTVTAPPTAPRLRKWFAMAAIVGLITFGLMSWAVIIYLRGDKQSVQVKVDDTWLKEQGGQLSLTVDGYDHTLTGPGFDIKVTLGDHGFSVKSGDTVVHNPQTFTIEKDGQQILHIDGNGMSLGEWPPPTNLPSPNIQAGGGQSLPSARSTNELETDSVPSVAAKTRVGWDLIFTEPDPVYGIKRLDAQVVTLARPILYAPKGSPIDRLSIRRLWFKPKDLFSTGNTYDVRDCQAWMLSDKVAAFDLEAVPESSTDEQLAIRPHKPLPDGAYGVVLHAADPGPLPTLLSTFVVNGLSKPAVENCQVIVKDQGSATIEARLRNDGDGALNDTQLKIVLSRINGAAKSFVRRMNLNGFDVAAHDSKQLQLTFDVSKEMAGEYQLSLFLTPMHEDADSYRVAHADSNIFQIDNSK